MLEEILYVNKDIVKPKPQVEAFETLYTVTTKFH